MRRIALVSLGVILFAIVGGGKVFSSLTHLENKFVPLNVNDKAVVILRDKSSKYFEVINRGFTKNGVFYFDYNLSPVGEVGEAVRLVGGVSDGVMGGCARQGAFVDPNIISDDRLTKFDVATDNIDLAIRNLNKDSFLDIEITYDEIDCHTKAVKSSKKIFYATDGGFVQAEESGN